MIQTGLFQFLFQLGTLATQIFEFLLFDQNAIQFIFAAADDDTLGRSVPWESSEGDTAG